MRWGPIPPAWLVCAGAQLAGAGAFFALPDGGWRATLLVTLATVTVAALTVAARRLRRGPQATQGAGWAVLAAAQGLNVAAWACWYLYPTLAGVELPSPSVGDWLFLASYGTSALGLALIARRHGADRRAVLDVAVVGVAVGVLTWTCFIAGSAGAPGMSLPARLVAMAYPALDVVLLAAAVALALSAFRTPRATLLVTWAAVQLTGDVIFNIQLLDGSFRLGGPVFVWWLLSLPVLSAAALYPPSPVRPAPAPTWLRYLVVAAGVLPLPALLLIRAARASTADVAAVTAGSMVVTVLVVVRLSLADGGVTTGAARAALRRTVLRLCAAFTALALLPLLGLCYLSISEATKTVRTEVDRRLTTSADVTVAYVDDHMAALRALVASYAERRLLADELGGRRPSTAELQRHLAALESRGDSFVGAWAMDAAGTMLAFDPPQPGVVGRNFAQRDYFQGAMRTGRPYVSDAFEAMLPGNPRVVAVAAPVFYEGRVVGLIGLGYRLEALATFTGRIADVQNVVLKLTDRRGTLLAGPGSEQPGLPSGTADRHVRAALAGQGGTGREREDGHELVTAYRPVPALGWAVVAEVPTAVAFAGANRFTGRIVAVASLLAQVLLAGLVLAVRAERRRRAAEVRLGQREEQVSGILQAAGDAFVSVDEAGRVTRWNSQAEATFGWPAAEALSRPLADLAVLDDDREEPVAALARASAGRDDDVSGARVEVRARRRDGQPFPAELNAWATSAGDGVTFSAFVRDITDRKRTEAEIAAARDAAVAASRLKSEFVANMSHEIRTPMNGVIGLTSLLLDTDLDARQRDYLTTVQNSADALLNVINDILDFSKIEAGKLDIDAVDFDVRSLVEDVVSLLAATAQAKGLEIAGVVTPALPPALRGDAHRIRQVLTNLAANAAKFTEHGEVVVEVGVGEPDADGVRAVTFAVVDTGIGIPAERQADLFDAFTQADASTTRRYGGTGLGLTISRRLVELMGGTIGLESEVERGSRFHFTLPLRDAEAPLPSQDPSTDLTGVRVLVVDDNATNRTLVHDLLATWGVRPHAVPGANEALRALHEAVDAGDPFTVALLDMHMPGLDGLDLARVVGADGTLGGTRLAMLTSTNQAGEAQAARESGVEVYLTKPVRAAQLRMALLRLLGRAEPARPRTEPADASGRAGSRAPTTPGRRILVAEDNEVNQQVVVEMLASLGYAADVAADGAQALRLLADGRYDAVLMDCQMPVIDGFEATRRIRRLPAPTSLVPVIALTASALAADQDRCRAAGMDAFLAKPLRRADLDAALRAALPAPSAAVPEPAGPDTAEPDTAEPDTAGPDTAEPGGDDLLDPDAIEELLEMSGDFVGRVLSSYLGKAPAAAAAIRAAAARQDMEELARLAHKLRGSSGTLAGQRLAATLGALEQAAQRGDADTVAALAGTIEEETRQTCAALRSAFDADDLGHAGAAG